MKKIILTIFIGIFILGLITAGAIIINSNINVSKGDLTKLENVNSVEITNTPVNCNNDYCDIVYIKTGYGNTIWEPKPSWNNCTSSNITTFECYQTEIIYYTNEELGEQLIEIKEDLTNRILTRININEEQIGKTERVSEGVTTIS